MFKKKNQKQKPCTLDNLATLQMDNTHRKALTWDQPSSPELIELWLGYALKCHNLISSRIEESH